MTETEAAEQAASAFTLDECIAIATEADRDGVLGPDVAEVLYNTAAVWPNGVEALDKALGATE